MLGTCFIGVNFFAGKTAFGNGKRKNETTAS